MGIDHWQPAWTDIHLIQKGHCATIEGLPVVLVWYAANSFFLSLQATFPNIFLFEVADVECSYFPIL